MINEFNLSDKVVDDLVQDYIPADDVKEFIKRLKEEIEWSCSHDPYAVLEYANKIIDKLAGDKLI